MKRLFNLLNFVKKKKILKKGSTFSKFRSDHGLKIRNLNISVIEMLEHKFSALRTLQQNGVVAEKNSSRNITTMLNENNLPLYCWAKDVNTAYYIIEFYLDLLPRTLE